MYPEIAPEIYPREPRKKWRSMLNVDTVTCSFFALHTAEHLTEPNIRNKPQFIYS